ncbi:tryptophan 7-halogenase [Paraglaciecola aquimarina]|uniref:Tryptophan 7-halogenase n=1 Tax=Paraglaciecola algarum TaxID=3050085 RepID=A0ABS9D715_9ALTE|nr:tryptophan halogenase family protein [Paraglaciecola sp. G1-23]MCF2948762.1 tryptophan 7-halogenase [Paraglaciecola sp. G1-23]
MKRQKVVILGGGSAGWMTAASLSRFLNPKQYEIVLVESEQIGTVGVGEATLPHLRSFNQLLGIDENEFMRETGATYKLAIQFPGWGKKEGSYFHPFGLSGHDINGVDFHHYWLRLNKLGKARPFDQYSIAVEAAQQQKFRYPSDNPNDISSNYGYAFHLDASLYAKYLRKYSEALGVTRIEGKVAEVQLHHDPKAQGEIGDVARLCLESGQQIEGDFFIDCSGFIGFVIEKTLKTGYENWTHWLPCDRAIAVPTERINNPPPYTRATAKSAGWQWRIPLQHRTGNGIVYSSAHMSEGQAEDSLLHDVEESPTADLNKLRFVTGKRNKSWQRNCVAIGLSAGFLEPLESTSLYLIQIAIQKLLEHFPNSVINDVERDSFNRHMDNEYLRVRDFIILHYKVNQRQDSDFWRDCQSMSIPDTLSEQMALFEEGARISAYRHGLFLPASWLAVYLGQGLIPNSYDARVDSFPEQALEQHFAKFKATMTQAVSTMPEHAQSISKSAKVGQGLYPVAVKSLYGINA